jgi:hypothetical protein
MTSYLGGKTTNLKISLCLRGKSTDLEITSYLRDLFVDLGRSWDNSHVLDICLLLYFWERCLVISKITLCLRIRFIAALNMKRTMCPSLMSDLMFQHSKCLLSWLFSPTDGQQSSAYGSYGSTPHAFPNFHHPSHELLKDNGFVWHVYHKYHSKCLKG